MIRIIAPYFVAGVVLNSNGNVVRAAPIIRYMIGWGADDVRRYCRKKGWGCEDMPTLPASELTA